MKPEEIASHNERVKRLNLKLDSLEESVIDKLNGMLEGTLAADRDTIQICSTAAGVLKANKRSIPPDLPEAFSDPTGGLIDDADELPTNFKGDRA